MKGRARGGFLGVLLTAIAAMAGCDTPAPDTLTAGSSLPGPGVAVVCSDFVSTAVALVNADGRDVVAPLLIHSGQRPPGLQTALSGDIVLPTMPHPDGLVVLIDRHPNAALTFVEPQSGRIERQFSVATGFASNPHDVAVTSDRRLLVTRYGSNSVARRPDGLDRGDDVLVVAEDGTPLSRLGFEEPDGFPGRPDRIVAVAEDLFWVSLNRVSAQWEVYRSGRVARLRWVAATRQLERMPHVALDELANCGAMAVDGERVVVSCTGAWDADAGGYDSSTSGLALVSTDGTRIQTLMGTDARVGLPISPAVAFGAGGHLYFVQYGQGPSNADRVMRWTPDDDQVATVYEAAEPWTLWGLGRTHDGVPLLPDATPAAPRLCRLEDPVACIAPCAATGLPPKAVAPFL